MIRMKKILMAAIIVAGAGTLYGAYAWGSQNGPSDEAMVTQETRATLCSLAQEDYLDAKKALDNVIAYRTISLPLRAWGRSYRDTTNPQIRALVEEAAYQQERRLTWGGIVSNNCFPQD